MSEQNKNSQNADSFNRPVPSSEQNLAFRAAYSMLLKRAREQGSPVEIIIGEDGTEAIHEKPLTDQEEFSANSTGGYMLVDTPIGTMPGWVYGYDEELAYRSGKLGSFTVSDNITGEEQDLFEFYLDGNVEKRHYSTYGSGDIAEDQTVHVGWLSAVEIQDLALTIENSYSE